MKTIEFDRVEIRKFGYWDGCTICFKGKNVFMSLEVKKIEIEDIGAIIHEVMGRTPDARIQAYCSPEHYSIISKRTLESAKSVKELFGIENIVIVEEPNA